LIAGQLDLKERVQFDAGSTLAYRDDDYSHRFLAALLERDKVRSMKREVKRAKEG
jgi:hypothetical protein